MGTPDKTWTILSLLNWTTDYFTKHSIPTPRLDAEVLLAYTLGLERLQLYLQFERPMTSDELANFKEKIQRRIKGEPVSYIRGLKEFWSLPLKVGPGVLVPRPDTEVLVETVARRWSLVAGGKEPQILEIGTGSGNIAIALAKELPTAQITTIDVSIEALNYAKKNAREQGIESQITFIQMNFLKDDPKKLATSNQRPATDHFDLILSNPPYIPTQTFETLDPGIKDYEPRLALDGGIDGLDFYRRMGEVCPSLLVSGGLLAVEIGEEQADAVKKIFGNAGLQDIEVIKDYAGLDRMVMGKKWTK